MNFASRDLLFVLLVLPALIWFARWLERRPARYAVAFTNLDLLAATAGSRRRYRRWLPLALLLLAVTAAIFALAGPRLQSSSTTAHATVVLLVDTSGSMNATDVEPTRLGAAQAAMDAFAARAPPGVKIGLVAFSSTPAEIVPPTTERSALRQGIETLSADAATAIGDGLRLAVSVAERAPHTHGGIQNERKRAAIVLLSDGAQTYGRLSPLSGAELARAAGISVDTVGLGSPRRSGRLQYGEMYNKPDLATLAAIASTTGGRTYEARSARRLSSIYRTLSTSLTHRRVTVQIASWFSGIAAFLLLAAIAASRLQWQTLP
jgi:Ca-activated chloride channel family protein